VIGRHHLHFVDIPVVSGMRYQRPDEPETGEHST
jgi:hypothetical protein